MINGKLTSAEVANRLGVTIDLLRQWRHRGVNFIPYIKHSHNLYLYDVKDVDAYEQSRRVTSPPVRAGIKQ